MPVVDVISNHTVAADSSDILTVPGGSNASSLLVPVEGWVATGKDRGSIDILWSCSITIFLCIWAATYPNAPAPKDRWYHLYIDKLNLALLGILGPDALFGLALGQLSSAIRSRNLFRKEPLRAHGEAWSIRKGFFADMGGFHMRTPDFPEGFPIDAEQLHFLIKHGFLEFPSDDLWEHAFGGIDVLSRVITVLQVTLFAATEIDRVQRGYPMTTLELTALSFAGTMIGTSAAWILKPSVSKPYVLESSTTVSEIRERAGSLDPRYTVSSLDTWYQTPLMFLSRSTTFRFGVHYIWMVYFAHTIGLAPLFSRPMRDPHLWDRFFSDNYVPVEPNPYLIVPGVPVWIFYAVIFLLAWNFHFPTDVERLLWRISAVVHCILTLIAGTYVMGSSLYWVYRRKSQKRQATMSPEVHLFRGSRTMRALPLEQVVQQEQAATRNAERRARSSWFDKRVEEFRNLSPDHDPKMRMPLRMLLPFGVLIACFFVTRFYVYAQDFASMRELPAGAYVTTNKFLPFIGN